MRYSAKDNVWTQAIYLKDNINDLLRSASPKSSPPEATKSTWLPVTAMVDEGLAASNTPKGQSQDPYQVVDEHSDSQQGDSLSRSRDYLQLLPFQQDGIPSQNLGSYFNRELQSQVPVLPAPVDGAAPLIATISTVTPATPSKSGIYSVFSSLPTNGNVLLDRGIERTDITTIEPHSPRTDQTYMHNVYNQQQSLQSRFLISGRSGRKSIRDAVPTQGRPSLRRLPSTSLLRKDTIQRNSGLSRQRKQSIRYPRYQTNKPLPHIHPDSKAEVCLKWINKPLPPVPAGNRTPSNGHNGEEFAGRDGYHEAESSRINTDGGKNGVLSVIETRNVHSDQHCPLTDGSEGIQLMGLPAKTKIENESILTSTFPNQSSPIRTSPASRLHTFRFPATASSIEKKTLERSRLHRHRRHQSLPYSRTHSRFLSRALEVHTVLPSEITRHVRNSSVSTGMSFSCRGSLSSPGSSDSQVTDELSDLLVLAAHSSSSEQSASGKQVLGPEKFKKHDSKRLRRNESNKGYYHRPSLSLDSTKKALLSLQDRRLGKPHAKIKRLPEIKTGVTSPSMVTVGAVELISMPDSEAQDGQCTSETAGGDLLYFCGDTSHLSSEIDDQTASTRNIEKEISPKVQQKSFDGVVKDIQGYSRVVLKLNSAELEESETSEPESTQNHNQYPDQASPVKVDKDSDISSNLTNESQEQTSVTFEKHIPKSKFGTALSSALEALTIDSKSEVDARETKRFVKRSHALKELEATEESYVRDLDILLNVYLRVLETKAWFPQHIHVRMRRCVTGFTDKCSDQERSSSVRVYRNLAESVKILSHDNYLYNTFCELRMRTVNEISRSTGQGNLALLRRESKELMLQQGRPSSRSDLKDYLIKPIQRICRYPLLLKEILRLTNENDSEYQFIEQAYQLLKEKACDMDETQRMVERRLLTEQFLKKLPETTLPRKTSSISNKDQSTSSDMNLGNNVYNNTAIHPHQTSSSLIYNHANNTGLLFNSGFVSDNCFDFGPGLEGFNPTALTKAFVGTLGSIILAGALEYVLTPDMPIRLKYYGCFLFESMLIVVKAKKSNLYEPRQWFPLRLCELHETTRLDGYTRFGWRIMFDQFRIDFGANNAAEQQIWINTLRDRIRAAKDAHVRVPRDITTFETIVSSLPWKANSSLLASYSNTRPLFTAHQSPLPSPSPWSSCSSSIPSPLMPPPSSVSSSTMMMAMSSMVTIEPEKWNSRGPRQTIDGYTFISDHIQGSKVPEKARQSSIVDREDIRIGGMACNWDSEKETFEQSHVSQPRTALEYHMRPETQTMNPSTPTPTPMSWLLYENRPRNNSFDVTRVFASSHNSIKPNQRVLVQSLFKDVSTEHIWTSTSAVQPSSQPASAISRHSSSNPLNLSQSSAAPSSPQLGGSGIFNISTAAWGSNGSANFVSEDNHTPLPAVGSPSSSLTSRILRRRGSNLKGGHQEKNDIDRRRNSALSLNFRKNSYSRQYQHHRRSSSIVEAGTYSTNSQKNVGSETPVQLRAQVLERPSNVSQALFSPLSNIRSSEDSRDEYLSSDTGKEVMDTLNSVGEAARSRRGSNDKVVRSSVGKSLRSSSSSHSLPAKLRSTNSSALSLLISPTADVPKDNVDKLWSAMGRIIPRRVGGAIYDKSERSRANSSCSNSSSHINLMNPSGDSTPYPTSSSNQGAMFQSQLNNSHEHCTFQERVEQSSLLSTQILRRTSTRDSRSTTASRTSSLGYSSHTRTDSMGSSRSLQSDVTPDGNEVAMSPSAPTLITSVSDTNCNTKTRNQDPRPLLTQDKNQPTNTTDYRPPLPIASTDRKSDSTKSEDNIRYQHHDQTRPDLSPLTPSQDRRKSLSLFQNITNSAQKFRTMIKSQNGQKRRTVMGLTPVSMESRTDSFGEGTVEKVVVQEKNKGSKSDILA
ncbi:hypothetical protein BGZ49_007431 [Haplosporangium sp. Z 27]|nr:hypothetical protein BGZ49_007431 [Haplosporangium sp. Z 27]